MKFLQTLKDLFNHERYESIAIVIAAGLLIWFYGCDSKVPSITDPAVQVNRTELQMEIDQLLSLAEYRYTQLDEQDRIKEALLTHAILVAQGGTLNPIAVVTAIAGILGIGATVDNVRKRKEIKSLKG